MHAQTTIEEVEWCVIQTYLLAGELLQMKRIGAEGYRASDWRERRAGAGLCSWRNVSNRMHRGRPRTPMWQLITPVLTLTLGAVLGAGYSLYISRPKLAISGGGSGGILPGLIGFELRVSNMPGLLGVRLADTIILGRQVHRPVTWGLTVDRRPAYACTARLYDKATKELIGPLTWMPMEGPALPEDRITIECGQQYRLIIFVRLPEERLRYFLYRPLDTNTLEPTVPDDAAKFSGTRKFYIEISYSYDRQHVKTNVRVRQDFEGMLHYQHEGSGGSF